MASMTWISCVAALAGAAACRDDRAAAPARAVPPGPAGPPASNAVATAELAAGTWASKGCTPAAVAGQRVGRATVELRGDGVDVSAEVPALCGGLHEKATNRFAVGDGTLVRACLPDGSILQISADVALSGPVGTTYRYENYRAVGPLIELYRAGVGTYNQRDDGPVRPGETVIDDPALTLGAGLADATLRVSLQWPGHKPVGPRRIVNARATWACPLP
ncbi:MAG: hypothetical protein KBG28_06110 [Kofleriaceae bacterium]|nr:hypothetical protein [Kofleriaceae bacterium]MBP9203519.1 hypothetical protein [Kofleriaceae bacterium]